MTLMREDMALFNHFSALFAPITTRNKMLEVVASGTMAFAVTDLIIVKMFVTSAGNEGARSCDNRSIAE